VRVGDTALLEVDDRKQCRRSTIPHLVVAVEVAMDQHLRQRRASAVEDVIDPFAPPQHRLASVLVDK
jgi:hypothetical protein